MLIAVHRQKHQQWAHGTRMHYGKKASQWRQCDASANVLDGVQVRTLGTPFQNQTKVGHLICCMYIFDPAALVTFSDEL